MITGFWGFGVAWGLRGTLRTRSDVFGFFDLISLCTRLFGCVMALTYIESIYMCVLDDRVGRFVGLSTFSRLSKVCGVSRASRISRVLGLVRLVGEVGLV